MNASSQRNGNSAVNASNPDAAFWPFASSPLGEDTLSAFSAYFTKERALLSEIGSGNDIERAKILGDILECAARLNALEAAETNARNVNALVQTRTTQFQENRKAYLDKTCANLHFDVEIFTAHRNATNEAIHRRLGESGIPPPPGEEVSLDNIGIVTENGMKEVTKSTKAGSDHIHAGDDPNSPKSARRQWLKLLVEWFAIVALAAIQSIAFGHGTGLLTPSNFIHGTMLWMQLIFWVICIFLTACSGALTARTFRLIARSMPCRLEPSPMFAWRSKNVSTTERQGVKRFTSAWTVWFFFLVVILIEIGYVSIKTDVFQVVAQKAADHKRIIEGKSKPAATAEPVKPVIPAAIAMGLVLTVVFAGYKGAGAICEEENLRRHAYLDNELMIERESRRKTVLGETMPNLVAAAALHEAIALRAPRLAGLEDERDKLQATTLESLSDLVNKSEDNLALCRTQYEAARQRLFETIKSFQQKPPASFDPPADPRPSAVSSRIGSVWNSFRGLFSRSAA